MLRFSTSNYIKAEGVCSGDTVPEWVVTLDNSPVEYDYDSDSLVVFKQCGEYVKRWLMKEKWCRESMF